VPSARSEVSGWGERPQAGRSGRAG